MKLSLTMMAGLALAWGQPFATGPRQHPPAAGQEVDVRLAWEDAQGYVWVSGPRGTFRYDGTRYIPASAFGLPMGEAAQIEEAGGNVWVLVEEELWRFDGSRFHRFAGAFNSIAGAGPLLYVDLAAERRIAVVGWRGTEWAVLATSTKHPRQYLMQAGADGRVWFGAFSALSWVRWNGQKWEEGSYATSRPLDDLRQVAPAADGGFLATNGFSIFRFGPIEEGRAPVVALPNSESRHPREHVFGSRYGTWVMVNGGVVQVLADGKLDFFRYAGTQAIYGLRQGKRVLWAAAGRAGLLAFSRSQGIEWIQPENSALGLAKAAARQGGRLLFGRADLTYEVVADGGEWDFGLRAPVRKTAARQFGLPASNGPYEDTAFAPDGSVWHVLPKEGAVHVSGKGQWIGTAGGPPGPRGKAQMRRVAVSDDGRIWIASRQNLWEVDLRPPPDYLYRRGGAWQGSRHIAEFFRDGRGRLHAVADGGLLRYEGGRWEELGAPDCLLSAQLRTAAVAEDGTHWFAYRDRGGVTRAARSDARWTCAHFEGKDGFGGETTFLRVDRRGRMWRGSREGITIVPAAWSGRAEERREIGAMDGLMEGEMTGVFAEEPDGSYLVGVGPTLQRIPALFLDGGGDELPAPEGIWDGTALHTAGERLETKQGAGGELLFSVLPGGGAGARSSLEYRVDGGEWRRMENGGVRLEELVAGEYGLDARFAGAPKWVTLPVRVEGVWWRSGYFHSMLAVVFLAGGWWLRPVGARMSYRMGKWWYLRFRSERVEGTVDRTAPEWEAGMVLRGRYEVDGLLASGGFSDVYAAEDRTTGAAVVIKRLRLPERAAMRSSSWLRERFLREVGVVSLIRDAGVLPVLDTWFDEGGTPHIVLPRVFGVTLRAHLDQHGKLALSETVSLLESVADTLQKAHEQGVVHCDLKPENILIPADGEGGVSRPIVIDFGTAALHLQTDVLSETTVGAGSIRYMAPEQMLGRYSPASDVYAFASLALELIGGRSYASLDLAIDRNWEQNFTRKLGEMGIGGRACLLLVGALRWDPTQRRDDIREWTREFVASLAEPE